MSSKPCKTCRQPILFARKAEDTTKWTVLNVDPVTPSAFLDASTIRIVSGVHAYRLEHLKETLQIRRELSTTLAHDAAAEDFSWHTIHHCKEQDT